MKVRVAPTLFLCVMFLLPLLALPLRAHAEDWLPIDPQDLAMKDNPKHPGDHAMILWREVQFNEHTGAEQFHVCLKIFDEEGKRYANFETQEVELFVATIGDIQGRTIHPDGTVIDFSGETFEKTVTKYHGFRWATKAFTLPNVTPGSILEVRYTINWNLSYLYRHHWRVQSNLYQRKAHFMVRTMSAGPFLRWHAVRIPDNQLKVKGPTVELNIEDMAGYEVEPYMPPDNEVVAGVYFFHAGEVLTPDEFWKEDGGAWRHYVEDYVNWPGGAVKRELASLLSPADTSTVKLRKIYDRIQSFKNLSFLPQKSEKEIRREKQKENENIDDLIRHGYGWHNQLNRLFLAMARNAGFDATLVRVPDRSEAYLDKNFLSSWQIIREIVLVRDGGKDIYLDPGTRFCPFGVLPWENTSVMGLKMDKVSPTWATVPALDPENVKISRKAVLQLQRDGSVQGEITLTFVGHEAMDRRLIERDLDEAGRKKDMEDLLRGWLPTNGTLELQKVNDWQNSNLPLVATYQVKIPGYAGITGHRTLLPTAFFGAAWASPFTVSHRANNMVFPSPSIRTDDVTISLPEDMQVESLPAPKSQKNGLGEFSTECKNERGALHAIRQYTLKRISLEARYYPAVRGFYGQMAATQDEQAVLTSAAK